MGTWAGIIGSPNFTESEGRRTVEKLHFDRKRAVYGARPNREPYDEATAD